MEDEDSNTALNISDLMASLMLFFLFISVAFMLEIQKENDSIKSIIAVYQNSQKELNTLIKNNIKIQKENDSLKKIILVYKKSKKELNKLVESNIKIQKVNQATKNIITIYQNSKKELNKMLHNEFDKDLKQWNAEITQENTIRFFIPFESASNEVPNVFKKILTNFFPRYINILIDNKIKDEIKEIRVEGHTSNVWNNAKNKEQIYLNNLNLSQERAKNVLIYLYDIDNSILSKNESWLEKKFRVNGMAFAKPIKINNKINWDKSRRVEFSIETKTEEKIQQIINQMKK